MHSDVVSDVSYVEGGNDTFVLLRMDGTEEFSVNKIERVGDLTASIRITIVRTSSEYIRKQVVDDLGVVSLRWTNGSQHTEAGR